MNRIRALLSYIFLSLGLLLTLPAHVYAQSNEEAPSSDSLHSKEELKTSLAQAKDSLQELRKEYKRLMQASYKEMAAERQSQQYQEDAAWRANYADSLKKQITRDKAQLEEKIAAYQQENAQRNQRMQDTINVLKMRILSLREQRQELLNKSSRKDKVTEEEREKARTLLVGPGNIDEMEARVAKLQDSIKPNSGEIIKLKGKMKENEERYAKMSTPLPLKDSTGGLAAEIQDKQIPKMVSKVDTLRDQLYGSRFRPYHLDLVWVQAGLSLSQSYSVETLDAAGLREGENESSGGGIGVKFSAATSICRGAGLFAKMDGMHHTYTIEGNNRNYLAFGLGLLWHPLYSTPVAPYFHAGYGVFSPLGEDAQFPTWGNGTGGRLNGGAGIALDGRILNQDWAEIFSLFGEYDYFAETNGSAYGSISFGIRIKPNKKKVFIPKIDIDMPGQKEKKEDQ